MVLTPLFQIGTTSYIIEDDLSVNALHLSSRVKEMELVLFELPTGPTNLPDAKMQECLLRIGDKTGLIFTIHLPKDLTLRDHGHSVMLAEKVLARTRDLPVYGVVAHISGWYWKKHKTREENPILYQEWLQEGRKLIKWLKGSVPESWHICVENVEGTPAEEIQRMVAGLAAKRCVDVGHLLKDEHPDPLGSMQDCLDDSRVIHLHGLNEIGNDHRSVALLDKNFLDQFLTILLERKYDGVLTLEVFGQSDFQSSMQAIRESMLRIGAEWEH